MNLHHESEDITALATSKTVEEPTSRIHRHRSGFLLMERADSHHRPTLFLYRRDAFDQLDDVGGLANPLDVIAISHAAECRWSRL